MDFRGAGSSILKVDNALPASVTLLSAWREYPLPYRNCVNVPKAPFSPFLNAGDVTADSSPKSCCLLEKVDRKMANSPGKHHEGQVPILLSSHT